MIDENVVQDFLAQQHLAVVGASDDDRNFGKTIVKALIEKGYDVVAVHPDATTVAGVPCYPDLASIPVAMDGAIVMVGAKDAAAVVRAAAASNIKRVWLFKGLGSKGAASQDAIATAHRYGMDVVEGACPLMFLEPVGWFHRVHRRMRGLNGAIVSEPRVASA